MRFSFLFRSVFTLIMVIVTTSGMLSFASSKISTTCYEIGIRESNKYITNLVSEIIDLSIDEEEFNASLIKDVDESYKEINVIYLQNILKNVTNLVYKKLDFNDGSYIINEIPISLIYENPLLATIGSNIPIKYKFTSDILVDLKSNVSSFGYNNALIEILLDFEFNVFLYIPLKAVSEKIKIDIPIYSLLLEGEVPSLMLGEHSLI